MLGCHDFQNAAGKFMEPNSLFFPFLWHPATVMPFIWSFFKSSSSNSIRVLLSSSNYSKALAPAVTPYKHWGRARLRIFCAIKLPAFISHAIQLLFLYMTGKKRPKQADGEREEESFVGKTCNNSRDRKREREPQTPLRKKGKKKKKKSGFCLSELVWL